MYTRKLVKSGLSSHTISLPQEFIRENKLTKGDLVLIEKKGRNSLLITANKNFKHTQKQKKVKVIIVGKRPLHHIKRAIVKAYVMNYNEIVIKLSNPNQAREIKKAISFLVALEVVQEDTKQIIAQDFLNYENKEIEKTIRRIEHIVHSMIIDLKDLEKNKDLAEIIRERDIEVNRLGHLIMRALRTAATDVEIAAAINISPLDIIQLWSLNIHLEKIGDEIKRVAKHLTKLYSLNKKNQFQKRKLDFIIDALIELYKNTFVAIHSKNRDLLDQNIDKRFELIKELDNYFEKNNIIEISEIVNFLKQILSHLADVNRIYRFSGF